MVARVARQRHRSHDKSLIIGCSGSFSFFNILTAVLCIPMLDDRGADPMAAVATATRWGRWDSGAVGMILIAGLLAFRRGACKSAFTASSLFSLLLCVCALSLALCVCACVCVSRAGGRHTQRPRGADSSLLGANTAIFASLRPIVIRAALQILLIGWLASFVQEGQQLFLFDSLSGLHNSQRGAQLSWVGVVRSAPTQRLPLIHSFLVKDARRVSNKADSCGMFGQRLFLTCWTAYAF